MTAAHRIAVTAEELGQRVDDDVGAVLDRAQQIGRRHGVVDDQRHAGVMGDLGNRRDVGDETGRVGEALDEDRLGALVDLAGEALRIIGVGPAHFPAEVPEGMAELVDRAAIELACGDEIVARRHQGVQRDQLR